MALALTFAVLAGPLAWAGPGAYTATKMEKPPRVTGDQLRELQGVLENRGVHLHVCALRLHKGGAPVGALAEGITADDARAIFAGLKVQGKPSDCTMDSLGKPDVSPCQHILSWVYGAFETREEALPFARTTQEIWGLKTKADCARWQTFVLNATEFEDQLRQHFLSIDKADGTVIHMTYRWGAY
jgi:hypothetical protein